MKKLGPYEARLAIRENLGFYNAATLGAIYEFDNEVPHLESIASWVRPLGQCIREQPHLAMVVQDANTDTPSYEMKESLNVEDHIILWDRDKFVKSDKSDTAIMEEVVAAHIDRNFSSSSAPPWAIAVVPLPARTSVGNGGSRYLVSFLFSHSIGDGAGGFAFHKTLLKALCDASAAVETTQPRDVKENVLGSIKTPSLSIPAPFDTPDRLPVTPEFLKLASGGSSASSASASVPAPRPRIWTGSPIFLDKQGSLKTDIRLFDIPAQQVQALLAVSKLHNSKMTAVFHQLVVRALSRIISDPDINEFASQTAIDLRAAAGMGSEWGICVSGLSGKHARVPSNSLAGSISPEEWESAVQLSAKLANASGRLEDQPIGMLKYVKSQRQSMESKLGAPRDGSYSVSNMLAFSNPDSGSVRISNMMVGSSAAVPSTPLSFCLVSVKGGSLTVSLNWQPGAIGIPIEEEDEFARNLFASIKQDLNMMSGENGEKR